MGKGGEVFVLDMGEPVKIADLARKMIHLMGLTEKTADQPEGAIEVRFTGLRPGEKLYEELLIGNSPLATSHPRILMAREVALEWQDLEPLLESLMIASQKFDCDAVIQTLMEAPTGFKPSGSINGYLDSVTEDRSESAKPQSAKVN
tara:strand:- start:2841 stop:3281 length:441 start_codon:yes stop_codon:yes gene_type:complete